MCLLRAWRAKWQVRWRMLLLLVLLVLQTTSEKALRKQLQEHFKTDMKEKKVFVKEHVSWRAAGGITAQQRRTAVQAAAALVGCSCQQQHKASTQLDGSCTAVCSSTSGVSRFRCSRLPV